MSSRVSQIYLWSYCIEKLFRQKRERVTTDICAVLMFLMHI